MPLSVGQTNMLWGTQTINTVTYRMLYIKTWACPNGTFMNSQNNLCISCPIMNCLECYNVTACKVCDEADSYFLNGIQCDFSNSSILMEDVELPYRCVRSGCNSFTLSLILPSSVP